MCSILREALDRTETAVDAFTLKESHISCCQFARCENEGNLGTERVEMFANLLALKTCNLDAHRCVLNWFGDWSTGALYQVGKEFTNKVDLERGDVSTVSSNHISLGTKFEQNV